MKFHKKLKGIPSSIRGMIVEPRELHPCVIDLASSSEKKRLLSSSTILIVLMKSVRVKGGWRAMHHRHVGGCRGRRGRRIRCWRQQRRTLKTNDQWQRGRGAQAHRVSSTFRHRTMPRPCWPRKRFFLQVHALKKSNKPVERSGFHGLQYGARNVLWDLIHLLPILLQSSSSSSSSWIFLSRFVFLSYKGASFSTAIGEGMSGFFFFYSFSRWRGTWKVGEEIKGNRYEIVNTWELSMDYSNYFLSRYRVDFWKIDR